MGNQSSAIVGQASMLFDRPVVETGTTGVSVQWGTLPGSDSERTVTPLVLGWSALSGPPTGTPEPLGGFERTRPTATPEKENTQVPHADQQPVYCLWERGSPLTYAETLRHETPHVRGVPSQRLLPGIIPTYLNPGLRR